MFVHAATLEIASLPRPMSHCLRVLTAYAHELDFTREEDTQKFWFLYKNDTHFESWLRRQNKTVLTYAETLFLKPDASGNTISIGELLTQYERWLKTPHANLDDFHSAHQNIALDIFNETDPTYEMRVISLRKGDTIHFSLSQGVKTFILGDFLGAGNSAHIFALAADPDTAIRIPFSSLPDSRGSRRKLSLQLAENYASKKPKEVPGVTYAQILPGSDPEHRFTLVTRFHGHLHAHEFLLQVVQEIQKLSKHDRATGKVKRVVGLQTLKRYEKLYQICHRLQINLPPIQDLDFTALDSSSIPLMTLSQERYLDDVRQLLLVEKNGAIDWPVVDWEE